MEDAKWKIEKAARDGRESRSSRASRRRIRPASRRFAERAHLNINAPVAAEMVHRAAAVAAQHAAGECASSTIMMQLYFSARSQSCGSGAMSPSIEKTPSVMSSFLPGQFSVSLQDALAIVHVFVSENLDGGLG